MTTRTLSGVVRVHNSLVVLHLMMTNGGAVVVSPPSAGVHHHKDLTSSGKFPSLSPPPDDLQQYVCDSGLHVGVCSQQGKRPYQEDEYAIRQFLGLGGWNGGNGMLPMDVRHAQSVAATHFFGLFDGHAGGRCSKHISSILPDVLTEDSLFLTNLPLALKRAFHTANDIFLRIAEQQRLHDGRGGIGCDGWFLYSI